jgi:hypothetical protein
MGLLAFRTYMVNKTGRLDLVASDGSYDDNGADAVINEACRMLDRQVEFSKTSDRLFPTLDAGDYYLEFQNCHYVSEVWVNNATGRSKLERRDLNWLKQEYDSTIAATTAGTPKYWAPARLRSSDSTDKDSLAAFFNHVSTNWKSYEGIIILGPADEDLVVEVVGQFFSVTLSDDDDENYWTSQQQELLVLACLHEMELLNRNLSGAQEILAMIKYKLRLIDQAQVSEDIIDITQIAG